MATTNPGPTGAAAPGPPGRATRRRAVVIAVAAGVVLAGVVGGVILLGGSGSAAPPTFREARAAMNGTVANLSGGGWSLLSGAGLDVRSGAVLDVPLLIARSGSTCTATAVGTASVPTSISVAAYSGSFAAGRAPLWVFLFRQPATGDYLLGDVLGGSAGPIAYLSGSTCTENLSAVSDLPTDLVDSPTIAADAWNGDGSVNASAFAQGDPAISGLWLLATGSISEHSATFTGWIVEYVPCAPFQSGTLTQETTYVAAFSPTGAVYGATTSTTGCPSG